MRGMTMNDHLDFKNKCNDEIVRQGNSKLVSNLTKNWFTEVSKFNYSHHFEWLGRPIIQYPQDIIGMQQILWNVKPDLIIETGVARGGSLIYYASILELLAQCGGVSNANVIGIDIDIREHNKQAILEHPMSKRIKLIQGSSIEEDTFKLVLDLSKGYNKVLVCLDSNHTHNHVLRELELYAPLVSHGSYCIVFDTIIEDMTTEFSINRPWGIGNNPKTAVKEFLDKISKESSTDYNNESLSFEIDDFIDNQLLISVASGGYLRRL
jgi:cephalosporin hydroxylase